jgi:hypothetical protein
VDGGGRDGLEGGEKVEVNGIGVGSGACQVQVSQSVKRLEAQSFVRLLVLSFVRSSFLFQSSLKSVLE